MFSNGESNARGVAILFRKDLNCKILSTKSDSEGRLLIAEVKIAENIFTICNVYGPNIDSSQFFIKLSKLLEDMPENKVLMGDFNVALDEKLDRYNSTRNSRCVIPPSKPKAREAILDIMNEFVLTDVWRVRNESKRYYSWCKRCPGLIASRIDYSLISQNLSNVATNVTYIPAINTDHTAVFLVIDFIQNERGKSYWKLNTTLLANIDFTTKVNTLIETYQNMNCHPFTAWEELKKQVQKCAQKISRNVTSERKLIISQLLEKIDDMQQRLPLPEHEDQLLVRTQLDLNQKVNENTKGMIFRSKVKWIEFGEKSSRYFFNLEKSKYNAKVCNALFNSDGELTTCENEIRMIQFDHYSTLYQKSDANFNMVNNSGVKVSDVEYRKQGQPLHSTELFMAIKNMKNGKTPGDDGLPIEFYKVFGNKLAPLLTKVYTTAFEEHRMPNSSMNGILNLIPKASKDTRYIQNLRPITLLNCDYKIIEKILSNRMETAMHDIIHNDQKGFLRGRCISVNIRKILDIIQYVNDTDHEAFILSLDFKSCFDLISFEAIKCALKYFGFADWIVKWTDILYTDYTIQVQNNGNFTDKIFIERSVHQGGVNSVYLFLCVAEILAINLRQNKHIHGVVIDGLENLLNQFADDMDVSSMYTQESLDNVLDTIDSFHHSTGFTLNYDKTKLYRVGSLETCISQVSHTKSDCVD